MMPYGWEGNRRSSHWQCVTDFTGLSTYGLNGLREGDEHPPIHSLRSMAPSTFLNLYKCNGKLLFLTKSDVVFQYGVKHGVWTVLMAYLTQQMLDSIKHITDDIYFFQEDSALVHMQRACNTVQLLRRSRLPFS